MEDNISRVILLSHTQKVSEIQRNHLHLVRHIRALKSAALQFLNEIFLEYSKLVDLQRKFTRMKVEAEKRTIQSRIKYTEVLYELKRFAFHVDIETRSKVQLIQLSDESPQYHRCEKAVQDNLNNVNSANDSLLKVIGVFKVENQVALNRFNVMLYFLIAIMFNLFRRSPSRGKGRSRDSSALWIEKRLIQ